MTDQKNFSWGLFTLGLVVSLLGGLLGEFMSFACVVTLNLKSMIAFVVAWPGAGLLFLVFGLSLLRRDGDRDFGSGFCWGGGIAALAGVAVVVAMLLK